MSKRDIVTIYIHQFNILFNIFFFKLKDALYKM